MISYIKLAGLRNNEYSLFLQNILSTVQRFDPKALEVEEKYNKLWAIADSFKGLTNESADQCHYR